MVLKWVHYTRTILKNFYYISKHIRALCLSKVHIWYTRMCLRLYSPFNIWNFLVNKMDLWDFLTWVHLSSITDLLSRGVMRVLPCFLHRFHLWWCCRYNGLKNHQIRWFMWGSMWGDVVVVSIDNVDFTRVWGDGCVYHILLLLSAFLQWWVACLILK